MKEAKIAVMGQVEDWQSMFADGWEYVTIMKNGYSVFQRDKVVSKPVAKPKVKKK